MNDTTTNLNTLIEIEPQTLKSLSAGRREALLDRGRWRLRELREPVRRILEDVRERGDAAALDYAARFDTLPKSLRVPEDEILAALSGADPAYLAALRQAAANIESFHRAQLAEQAPAETEPGVRIWRAWRPIERVGIYTPGGGALYPSCLLMSAIPARVAGCREVVVCTPPGLDGRVPVPVLAAAALAGVTEVYALGGPQAIAAMAYGTETICRVDKIFGPGSSYVAAAKAQVAGEVAIDLPAGPSEILIVADETANPAWVAADLLAQAEHGPESACVLITTSQGLAQLVHDEMARQITGLPTAPVIRQSLSNNGALLLAESMDEALEFANAYAAEHLEIVTRDPLALVERIQHAGSVFLGSWSGVAAGDYASGGNHTLPTAGYARGFGPLAIEAFGRWMQIQQLDERGFGRLRDAIQTLATAEGLPGHAASARIRVTQNAQPASDREETQAW